MICANMIAFGKATGATKPYKARIEYLGFTGTQFIDTGLYYDSGNWKCEANVKLVDASENYFISQRLSGLGCIYAFVYNVEGVIRLGYNINAASSSEMVDSSFFDSFHTFNAEYSNGSQVLSIDDGVYVLTANQSWKDASNPDGLNIVIGGIRTYGNRGKGDFCGEVKIWHNGVYVRSLIPVLDKAGVACMYDEVSGEFFYNQGTGEFVAGPEIIEYTAKDYIQDGLIAMWDGIDASVNTVTFSSTDGVEFDGYFGLRNNAASNKYISITDVANIEEAYKSGEFTFETVIDFATYTNTFVRIEPAPYKLWCFSYEPYIQLRDSFIGSTTSVNTPLGITSLKAKSSSTKNWQTQINTTIRSTTIADDIDFSQAEITRINCGLTPSSAIGAYRFYNRPLTDEEIAYNYNIDKQRFNLP